MNKKLKENLKRIVGEGLSLILTRLQLSKPSSKMEAALKKHSKKLIVDLKKEIKRNGKKKTSDSKKVKSIKKPVKSISRKTIKKKAIR